MASTYCRQCGSEMAEGTAHCTACGAPLTAAPTPPQQYPSQPTSPQQYYLQPQSPPQYAQYSPQYPPQYAPQYPQPPKRSGIGRFLTYSALGCAALLAIGVLIFVGISLLAPSGPEGGDVVLWHATYDQNRVLDEFGPPQAFVIGYGEDHLDAAAADDPLPIHRVETWDYWDMRTRFEFKDGVAIGTTELPAPEFAVYTPAYTPLDFSLGMTPSDVAQFMQVGPSASATLDQQLFPGMTIDSFFDELYVSYQDDGLVGVESSLLSLEGGS